VESTYHFEYGLDLTYGSRTEGDIPAGSGSDPVAASSALQGLKPNKTYHFRIVGSNASGSIVGSDNTFTTLTAPPDVDGTSPAGSSPAFASAIGPRSARLHGTVNPNSNVFVQYYLEYGTTTAYGNTAVDLDSDSHDQCFLNCSGDDIPVIGSVSGLEPGTTYHFRAVAVDFGNGGPLQFGADQTFVTAPAAGGGATDVTTRRATLTGTIDPHGVATSYHFNYGPTTSYGARTPEVEAGSADGDRLVSQEVAGLLPDTTYHVQVVATSVGGVVRTGADGLFRTAAAPTAAVIAPTGISTDAATLMGEVDTFGLAGSYHFDVWSLDSGYSTSTPERPVAGNASAERVSASLAGLPPDETFVVQMTVTSNDSVGVSDMLTFATAAVPGAFAAPPASDTTTTYGCGSPRLDAFDERPKPGEMIAILGHDLGVGGSVVLGDRPLEPVGWSAGGFQVSVPDDATGTLGLTVNCGHRSNTIAVQVASRSSVKFATGNLSAKARRKASRSGRLPLRVLASSTGTVTLVAKAKLGKGMAEVGRVSKRVKAGTMTRVTVLLNSQARKRLRSGRKLGVTVAVRQPGARTRTTSILLPGVTS
jgi:hypothetical protein